MGEGFCSSSLRICVVVQADFLNVFSLRELLLVSLHHGGLRRFIKILREALRLQLVRILLRIRLMNFPDLMIHLRLRKLRLIDFIMPILAITNQINHEIFLPLLPILKTKLQNSQDILHILRVNVDNRNIEPFGHIRGILCAPGIDGPRCVAYLVVSYYVDCPVYCVFWNSAKEH